MVESGIWDEEGNGEQARGRSPDRGSNSLCLSYDMGGR